MTAALVWCPFPDTESARAAADALGMPDVAFEVGDATTAVRVAGAAPELLVVNPPRRGLGADLADWIERSRIPTVVYSSCNAASLARDLEGMPSYRVTQARLFDMFPQSTHSEVMVLLERAPAA